MFTIFALWFVFIVNKGVESGIQQFALHITQYFTYYSSILINALNPTKQCAIRKWFDDELVVEFKTANTRGVPAIRERPRLDNKSHSYRKLNIKQTEYKSSIYIACMRPWHNRLIIIWQRQSILDTKRSAKLHGAPQLCNHHPPVWHYSTPLISYQLIK